MALVQLVTMGTAKSLFILLITAAVLVVLHPGRMHAQNAGKPDSMRVLVENRGGNSTPASQTVPTKQPELAILSVSAPTTNTTSGANFLIPVTCGNTTGLGVVSFQFDLIFDPAVIVPQMNPIQTFGTISDGMLPTYNVVGGNTLKVVFFTTTARTGAGTLFYFKFTAVGAVGNTSPLTWVNFMWNEGNPGASSTPGQVRIVGPTAAAASLTGRLLTSCGQPVGNAWISMTDTQGRRSIARSSPFGYFQFTDLPTGETYVLTVDHRLFQFGERVLTLSGDLINFDLIADP